MSTRSDHRAATKRAAAYVLEFSQIGAGDLALVGGKAQNLGILCHAGAAVPPGFCVTTNGFRAFVAGDPVYQGLLAEMGELRADDLAAVRDLGARMRGHLESKELPPEVAEAVIAAWGALGEERSYAVRSSATAEDLPTASFAGQQDTYLNVRGRYHVLARVRDCFASLYSDRAISYRIEQRVPHADVSLAAVVQLMVRSDKAGILFTADPITGHRGHIAIDAGFGLGESLVSGLVSADLYKVDKASGRLLSVVVGDKKLAIVAAPSGGTNTIDLPEDQRMAQVLDDREVAELAELGRRVEDMYGAPQDIEWCIEDGSLYIVQARPITSLYPVPQPSQAGAHAGADPMRVYVCFNHLQVMTDAMPPMSTSIWQLIVPLGREAGEVGYSPWSADAGGRLFLDVAPLLRQPLSRKLMLAAAGGIDDLAGRILRDLAGREQLKHGPRMPLTQLLGFILPKALGAFQWLLVRDVADQATTVRAQTDRLVHDVRSQIQAAESMADRLRAAQSLLVGMMGRLVHIPARIMAGLLAGRILRRLASVDGASDDERALLDEDIAALARGLIGNVTTDMDLAVGDLADVARPHPELCARLADNHVGLDELADLPGGAEFSAAMDDFLERYGMRAPSEIDISRARWHDDPSSILRTIAGNLAHAEPGAHRAHHADLERHAQAAAERVIERCRRGVLGGLRVRFARRLVRVHRRLLALREHPKFAIIRILYVIRSVVLGAGAELHAAGRLARVEDVWFLRMHELIDALDHESGDLRALAGMRAAQHERFSAMAPPRVITGEGEIPVATHDRDGLPENALIGSPASSGVIEGIARVVRDPTTEVLERGEILVAPFTDPGWTPLFLNAAGLVMEVGGLMTHGSVVAREYGIPAVVCVPDATKRLRSGMRVRVNGDLGYVEILEQPEHAGDDNSDGKGGVPVAEELAI